MASSNLNSINARVLFDFSICLPSCYPSPYFHCAILFNIPHKPLQQSYKLSTSRSLFYSQLVINICPSSSHGTQVLVSSVYILPHTSQTNKHIGGDPQPLNSSDDESSVFSGPGGYCCRSSRHCLGICPGDVTACRPQHSITYLLV